MSLIPASISAEPSVPINRIPNEIRGLIFKAHVDTNRPPWDLTLVSKSWRTAALGDPNLWTNIWLKTSTQRPIPSKDPFIVWSIKGYPHPVRNAGKWQLCTTHDDLLMCLERTRSAILSIKVYDTNRFLSSLQILLKPPLSSRIGRLDIELVGKARLDVPADELGPFPSLEYLAIQPGNRPYWIKGLMDSTQATAFKLTELFIGDGLILNQQEVDSISPLLQRIQHLEMAVGDLIETVLPHCGRLVTFKCNEINWPQHYDIEGNILAGIQSINLRGFPEALPRLSLPSVQTLIITDNFRTSALGWNSCHLVTLGEFNFPILTFLQARCPSLTWLTQVQAPALRKLDIEVLTDKCQCTEEKLQMEDTSSYPSCILKPLLWSRLSNLSTLILAAYCKEEAFNTVMDSIPSIKSLHLIPSIGYRYKKYGLTILDHLAAISTAGSLPQLEVIKFGIWRDPIYLPKETIDERVDSIIQSRRENGIEMLCFDVYWYKVMRDIKLEKYCL